MKLEIAINQNTKTTYALVTTYDDNTIDIEPINSIINSHGTECLVLPKNYLNRGFYSLKKVLAGELELSAVTKKSSSTSTKNWYDYLTDDEKEVYNKLMKVAQDRMNDPVELARRELEKAQAKLNALLGK